MFFDKKYFPSHAKFLRSVPNEFCVRLLIHPVSASLTADSRLMSSDIAGLCFFFASVKRRMSLSLFDFLRRTIP